MKVSKYDPVVTISKEIWIDHLNNPDSMFYRDFRTEKVLKLMFPKLNSGKSLEVIKLIKLEAMKLLMDEKRFGVYFCQNYLAKHIGTNQPNASRILHRLEKLHIIKLIPLAIQTKRNSKSCRTKLLVVPHPSVIKIQSNLRMHLRPLRMHLRPLRMHLAQFHMHLHSGSVMISGICRTQFRLLFRYLKYQGSLLKYTKVYFSSNDHFSNARIERGFLNQNLTKEKTMPEKTFIRHKLKARKRKKDIAKVTYEDYGLNPNLYLAHIKTHVLLEKYLVKLVNANIAPMTEETITLLKHWNSKKNNKLASIKEDYSTRSFRELRLVVTYRIYMDMLELPILIQAVTLFDYLSHHSRWLCFAKNRHSLTLTLLGDIKHHILQESWLSICQLSETDAFARCCGTKINHEKTFNEKLKPSFLEHFYPESEKAGLEAFKEGYSLLAKLVNKLGEYYNECVMCGLTPRELIDEYFNYIIEVSGNWANRIPSVALITKPKWIPEFIRWKAHQPGWHDFGKDKQKVEEDN